MNRITALIVATVATAIIFGLPLVYVAVTGDYTALVRKMTGLEEDSAVITAIFTARENFSA